MLVHPCALLSSELLDTDEKISRKPFLIFSLILVGLYEFLGLELQLHSPCG